jgi:hypothetical protein
LCKSCVRVVQETLLGGIEFPFFFSFVILC